MARFNRLSVYKETHIKTASGGKLIIMIYDEAIRQLNIALEALNNDSNKLDNISNSIIKSQDLITELIVSLDFDKGGEIASSLFSLYMFFNQQLMEANINKNVELLKNVRVYLEDLRGAWTEVVGKAGTVNGHNERASGINIAG